MGAKGDRASKEPLALRLFADGAGLTDISKQLDISDTTLRRWKEESLAPGQDIDGWEKARQQKRGNISRLKDLFERQLEYIEGLNPMDVSPPMMDTLSKLGALVPRWDKAELVAKIDKPSIFLENLEFLASVLKETDPEGLKALAKNFDELIIRFKVKNAQTT